MLIRPSHDQFQDTVRTDGAAMDIPVRKIFSAAALQKCREIIQAITIDDRLVNYIVSIVNATRPSADAPLGRNDIARYISKTDDICINTFVPGKLIAFL